MNKLGKYIFVSFLLVLNSCGEQKTHSNTALIYNEVLNELFGEYNQLVIVDSTLADTLGAFEGYKKTTPEFYDYSIKAKTKQMLPLDFLKLTNKDVHIISSQKVDSILTTGNKNSWDNFYDEYPNSPGLITITPIGFTEDSLRAWVELSVFKGGFSGFDATIRLEKINKEWKILGDITKGYY